MPLRLVIENTPDEDISPMPIRPSCEFIEAALRTANNSKAATRSAIIDDICEVLGCGPEELSFLFENKSVPNRSRDIMGLDLPDYRMTLSEIFKEAAE